MLSVPTFRNLTPHPVRLVLPSGRAMEWPPEARPARVVRPAPRRAALLVDGERVPVWHEAAGPATVALPDARPGVVLIVSYAAAAAYGRADVVAPATGPGEGAIRGASGCVVAVTAFKRARPAEPTSRRSL